MTDPQAQPSNDSPQSEPNVGQPSYGSQPGAGQPGGPANGSSYGAPVAGPPLSEADDRQWASFAHLGGILSFLPALIIWLVFKDRGRLTNTEGKEALNFQITLAIGYVAISVLSTIIAVFTFGIGGLLSGLTGVLWVVGVIFSIMGFLQAKDGRNYRYPFALRLIK
jgi:hypothetical protein